jgi:hypothetical protein
MAISQKKDAYTKHLGKFKGKQYGLLHILKATHIRNSQADLIQKYGRKCLQGGVQGIPKIHVLLGLKDVTQVLTDADYIKAGKKAESRTKTIIYNILERLYDDYFGTNGQADYMEFCKLLPNQKLPDATSPVIARCYANRYEIVDQSYLHDDYWYINKAFYEFYNNLSNNSTESADDWDEFIKKAKMLSKGTITQQEIQKPFQSEKSQPTPQPLAPHTQFAQLMAQVQVINADFHTFLCDCGFSFNRYEGNNLFVNIKNEIFADVIDNHIFAKDLRTIISNVFGSACKLNYTVAKNTSTTQAHTQAKVESIMQPPQTFTLGPDKRTGTTNIGKITATIPQTPKVYAEPQLTKQQKLKAAISKLAKFNNNFAIYLHNTLNYSKIENGTLFCMVTNPQAKDNIEKNRDFADLCQYLKQAFEVQKVVLEVYTINQNKL